MNNERRNSSMLIPTLIMVVLAAVLVLTGYFKGHGEHISGLKSALAMTFEIIPLLVFAFIVAGMVQVLLPQELISKWIGAESGLKGILIGSFAGILAPGGPFISFPIVAIFIRSGAGIGTSVAFITGWSLLAITRIPMEVGILGWKFVLIRTASTFFLPPIAGLIAQMLFKGVKLN